MRTYSSPKPEEKEGGSGSAGQSGDTQGLSGVAEAGGLSVKGLVEPWSGADYCGRVYCVGDPGCGFEIFAEHRLPDLEALKTEIDVARTLRELRSGGRFSDQPGQQKPTEVEDDA